MLWIGNGLTPRRTAHVRPRAVRIAGIQAIRVRLALRSRVPVLEAERCMTTRRYAANRGREDGSLIRDKAARTTAEACGDLGALPAQDAVRIPGRDPIGARNDVVSHCLQRQRQRVCTSIRAWAGYRHVGGNGDGSREIGL